MSKKDSSAVLKNCFKKYKDISKTYLNFKVELNNFKRKTYVVAVSGGPDSLALAALTKALSYERKIKFFYVLINHNIRKNSKLESLKVKSLLSKYGIKLNIISNTKLIKRNIQSEARNIRYKMLSNFCNKKNANLILTAHNLEDQVETFFIRLSRGSGLDGLSSMKPFTILNKKIYLFRPLLDVKKNQLIKISKKVFGKFFRDPSNKDTKFLRTRIRQLEKPLNKSGVTYDKIIKSIKNLAASKATLDDYFNKISKEKIKKIKGGVVVNLREYNNFNEEIKIKIINRSIKKIKKNYYHQRAKKVVNLIKNIDKKNFQKATLGGCLFFKKKDLLCVKSVKN